MHICQGQLELFSKQNQDVIEICAQCGRDIVVMGFDDGKLSSEFRGKDGECFQCRKRNLPP
jgi:hypothetical protein